MSPHRHHSPLARPGTALVVALAAGMTTSAVRAAAPASAPVAARAASGDQEGLLADALTRIGEWMAILVPPGFTPPAAALLLFAVGLAVWLAGGRYLRIALAAAGGIAGAVLALRMLPPAGHDAIDWAPIGVATVLGAIGAAAARRLVATAGLAVALGLMAPAAVIAWDGMAAPHLAGSASEAAGPTQTAAMDDSTFPLTAVNAASTDDPPIAPASASGPSKPPASAPATVLSRPEAMVATPVALGWGDLSGSEAPERTVMNELSAAAFEGAGGAARRRFDDTVRRLAARVREIVDAEGPSLGGVDRATTLAALAVAGLIAGLGLGLTRSEFAARAATATAGAALVLLGGLHLPAGLAPGGWIGPTAPEPVLLAWIALSGLGATLQWSYRPRSADIGR